MHGAHIYNLYCTFSLLYFSYIVFSETDFVENLPLKAL